MDEKERAVIHAPKRFIISATDSPWSIFDPPYMFNMSEQSIFYAFYTAFNYYLDFF